MTDEQIKALLRAAREADRALRPFADCVFYDNGDCVVSGMEKLSTMHFLSARFAVKKLSEALGSVKP